MGLPQTEQYDITIEELEQHSEVVEMFNLFSRDNAFRIFDRQKNEESYRPVEQLRVIYKKFLEDYCKNNDIAFEDSIGDLGSGKPIEIGTLADELRRKSYGLLHSKNKEYAANIVSDLLFSSDYSQLDDVLKNEVESILESMPVVRYFANGLLPKAAGGYVSKVMGQDGVTGETTNTFFSAADLKNTWDSLDVETKRSLGGKLDERTIFGIALRKSPKSSPFFLTNALAKWTNFKHEVAHALFELKLAERYKQQNRNPFDLPALIGDTEDTFLYKLTREAAAYTMSPLEQVSIMLYNPYNFSVKEFRQTLGFLTKLPKGLSLTFKTLFASELFMSL